MTIDQLEAAARAATPEPWLEMLRQSELAIREQALLAQGNDADLLTALGDQMHAVIAYIETMDGPRIIAMCEALRAATNHRNHDSALDRALTRLEAL